MLLEPFKMCCEISKPGKTCSDIYWETLIQEPHMNFFGINLIDNILPLI